MSGKRGRPTVYTQQIADEICERLAEGESLKSICSGQHFPPFTTVREWVLDDREGFAVRYARAREHVYEQMAEEIVAISDDPCMFDGKPDNVLVQRARLMSDNRKWLLSKMLPKQYGDRVTQELVGDGDRPIVSRIELVPISPRRPALEAPDED